MWVKCWYKAPTNYCRIYNAAGEPYYDEVYLPYDGGPAIPESELEVDPNLSNPAYIHLKNGRTLLPSTNFERHKALLDEIARSAEKK
jgi:hypothetical protein